MFHPNQRIDLVGRAIKHSNNERELAARGLAFLGWTAWTIVFGFSFSVFSWTYANVPNSTNIELCPQWLWNLLFCTMILGSILLMGYGIFAMLDNLFLKRNDTRRITREINVVWRKDNA